MENLTLLPNDQTPLLIFVNSVSGGGIAAGVIPYVENDVFIKVVKLPAEASTFHETHSELLRNRNLRIIAAGGDGTVNWVISLLKPIYHIEGIMLLKKENKQKNNCCKRKIEH